MQWEHLWFSAAELFRNANFLLIWLGFFNCVFQYAMRFQFAVC